MTARADHLVGVLGGMGPAATADFYARLIQHTPASRDQEHLRVVIWADPTVPDRVSAVLEGTDGPYPAMLAGARRLCELGVTVAAMPCNTAHVFLPRLVADTGLPFVDMIEETVGALTRAGTAPRAVGLLGTRGIVHSRLYQDRLRAAGIRPVEPGPEVQAEVDAAIRAVKRGELATAGDHAVAAVRRLAGGTVDAVVLACTELPVALRDSDRAGLPLLVDPTEQLAVAVVTTCLGAEAHRAG
ncbi:cysteate racemase [Amycolatopsis alkalitolerans]|uniref:Aspartate/glutamate racemase family protein n=1 Tax=Amycolatopsis alkalitolerans TaxID=2547244 RepID=A0A5C4M1B7_9PSEU|nr:amino acid racemase [Amycolatopsis alkalitolerans]TNC26442.1 aspartate/glutamate racemase family protein [Amycolatopsis alkalitolerans]